MNQRKLYRPTNSTEVFKKQVEEMLQEKRKQRTPLKNYFALPRGDAGIIYGSVILLLTTIITQKALNAGTGYYIADAIVSFCSFTYILGKRHENKMAKQSSGILHVVKDEGVFEEVEEAVA